MSQGPVLITGRAGQMARALSEVCAGAGLVAVALGRSQLDITDRQAVFGRVGALRPSLIFNTAAYTGVDKAEDEPGTAFALNRDGAGHIAEAAAQYEARLVHFSTDYVFAGAQDRALREDDETRPLGVYGQSKLEGEAAVRRASPQAAILRSSAIFSAYGSNFVKTMVRLAQCRDEVQVVDDQVTAPTPAVDLAELALRLAGTPGQGVFHAAGRPQISWAGFAGAIFDALARRGRRVPRLVSVTTEEFGAPAPRPAFSVLEDTRLDPLIGPCTIDWRPALERAIDAILAQE